MDLKSAKWKVFFWGWLRLLLGIVQMTYAAAGAGVLVTSSGSLTTPKGLFALKYDKIAGQIDL
jgi:hypothetical protein